MNSSSGSAKTIAYFLPCTHHTSPTGDKSILMRKKIGLCQLSIFTHDTHTRRPSEQNNMVRMREDIISERNQPQWEGKVGKVNKTSCVTQTGPSPYHGLMQFLWKTTYDKIPSVRRSDVLSPSKAYRMRNLTHHF